MATRMAPAGAAAKPSSVSGLAPAGDHSSRRIVTGALKQPTRGHCAGRAPPARSCSGWGLPCLLRHRRSGALLPHRFTLAAGCPTAVWFLWHFPAGHPDWPLTSTLPYGARTFLPRLAAPAITSTPPAEAAVSILAHDEAAAVPCHRVAHGRVGMLRALRRGRRRRPGDSRAADGRACPAPVA